METSTPTLTPTRTASRFPIIDEYSNAVAEAIRTGKPLPTRFRETWIQSRGGIEKISKETGIPPLGLEALLSTADSVARDVAAKGGQKTPSFTSTPVKSATPPPTPTPTPTGGFAMLMSPDGTKTKRVPWSEVADLIKAGWHEIE